MPFIGVYGNEYTWREMQDFCDRYSQVKRRPSENKNQESDGAIDNASTTVDTARAG